MQFIATRKSTNVVFVTKKNVDVKQDVMSCLAGGVWFSDAQP